MTVPPVLASTPASTPLPAARPPRGIPLRATMLMDAPHGAVRRALGRADVWSRTAKAMGGQAEVGGGPEPMRTGMRAPLRPGEWIRVHPKAGRPGELLWPDRPLIFRVLAGDFEPAHDATPRPGAGIEHPIRLPVLELVAGPLKSCRISLTTASTEAGTMVTIDFRVQASPAVLTPLLRRRVLATAQLFLGIAMLAAREIQVVVGGAVVANGTVLAARRTAPPELAGRWELPGGKVNPGETEQDALAREIAEELGLKIAVGDRLGGDVDLGENRVLRCYRAAGASGEPTPTEHDQVRWLGATELDDVDWLDADREILGDLRRVLLG